MTLKFVRWHWKTIGHPFYFISSFVHHFVTISVFKLELMSGNTQIGSKLTFFGLCNLEIWWMALKNNMALLLCCFKLCVSFHRNLWIQTRGRVRKLSHRVKIGDQALCIISSPYVNSNWSYSPEKAKCDFDLVTLTLDLWPWPFVNNIVIKVRETDGRTDGLNHS